MTALLEAALEYAALGWHVLPLRPGSKLPATAHGLHDATIDPTVIRAWWAHWGRANVGIRTGRCSGLFVLDIDARHGGYASLADLEVKYESLPPSLTVKTPSGGEHRSFAWPGGDVRNSAGALGPGLDIRGEGGYVVAPPSTLANGVYL